MKVTILSMSQALSYKPLSNSGIIRVKDGGYELETLSYDYKRKLILDFYDIEPRAGLPLNWNCFSVNDGVNTIKFFASLQEVEELVIHCHAGISRSPAIAIAYGWYTNNKVLVEAIKNGNYLPNYRVLEIMSNLIFGRFQGRKKYQDIRMFFQKKVSESNKNIKF